MKLHEIHVRDPFIYTDRAANCYYLYGRGEQVNFVVYKSANLEDWELLGDVFAAQEGFWGDRDFWTPEMHCIDGKYYIFATFANATLIGDARYRRSQILVSDRPEGPFRPHGGPITPDGWVCLDATYFGENGKRYSVFCHEWKQIGDGGMCLVELDKDLAPVGEAETLFHASDVPWVVNLHADRGGQCIVTDGPFLLRKGETLFMLWSSFSANGYAVCLSKAKNIHGPWTHSEKPFLNVDGGHGMVFFDLSGNPHYTFHATNSVTEHPVILDIEITEETIAIK